jgi:hypothetical protein
MEKLRFPQATEGNRQKGRGQPTCYRLSFGFVFECGQSLCKKVSLEAFVKVPAKHTTVIRSQSAGESISVPDMLVSAKQKIRRLPQTAG